MTIIPQTYFLDAPDLASATCAYMDAGLSICAPDGYYSDGFITRELSGCSFLPQQPCLACGVDCGQTLVGSGIAGIYYMNVDTGSTSGDVGAIVLRFNPLDVPDGFLVTFNGVTYNVMSSAVQGLLNIGDNTIPMYIGDVASSCGIEGGGTFTLPIFNFDGTMYIATGGTQLVTIAPSQVLLTTPAPALCTMVIPKTIPTPATLSIEIVNPCGNSGWTIQINCPAILSPINRSEVFESVPVDWTLFCSAPISSVFYQVPVNGSAGILGLYDWVFQDQFGEFILPDGYYKANPSIIPLGYDAFQVTGGVVVAFFNWAINC